MIEPKKVLCLGSIKEHISFQDVSELTAAAYSFCACTCSSWILVTIEAPVLKVRTLITQAQLSEGNLMFIGPCIIAIVDELKNKLDVTFYFILLIMCSTCFGH